MRNFLSGDLGPKSAFLVSLWSNATMCGISDMLTRHELACAYSRALLNEAGSMLKCEDGMYIRTTTFYLVKDGDPCDLIIV